MEMAAKKLDQDRFLRLWESVSIRFDTGHCKAVFNRLRDLYTEENRFYHSDQHIIQCLERLDQSKQAGNYHTSVELAIWFHDSIYSAGDPNNEKNSADWFRGNAEGHLPQDLVERVRELIVCTEHKVLPVTAHEKLTIDIDLSSFGMPMEKFVQDGRRIRQEFSDMSDEDFMAGQIRFLKKLVERTAIYSTEYFNSQYEDKARSNIDFLLESYDQGILP